MDAYIIAGKRTAVGKANRGFFKFTRPDDLAAAVIRDLLKDFPQLDKTQIDDVMVGNAMPEAEQGLNFARLISLMALDTDKVPGVTVNRYCASGLETIAAASSKIHAGMADCIIAGGAESMSQIPMGGWRVVPNPKVALEQLIDLGVERVLTSGQQPKAIDGIDLLKELNVKIDTFIEGAKGKNIKDKLKYKYLSSV